MTAPGASTAPDGARRPVLGQPVVAFGPVAEGWGSWEWAGADIARELGRTWRTLELPAWEAPACDVLVLVKHRPPPGWAEAVARRSAVVYSPIDVYGSAAEIDADGPWLRRCARILVHCERLRRYFEPYAPVEYVDHHVKFATPLRDSYRPSGDLLWIGVRSNLPPLVDWVNARGLPLPLDVLTNFEDPGRPPTPVGLGFRAELPVRLHEWSPALQVELTARARAVLDVKGNDFRSRHKPPAKAIDVLASGVPLAMNRDSSPVDHLARMGFDVCPPEEAERWFSRDYWEDTRRFGAALRELLSLERIGRRYRWILEGVLAGTGPAGDRGR